MLRGAIVEFACAGEIDDVLLALLNGNADNARESGSFLKFRVRVRV